MTLRSGTSMLVLIIFWLATNLHATEEGDIPSLLKTIKPDIVEVHSYNEDGELTNSGSGFFIGPHSVVTCYHVIEQGSLLIVTTHTGQTFAVDSVLAVDSDADLAVMWVVAGTEDHAGLKLASEHPDQGERVIVVGNPLGFAGSISDGLVAALRQIPDIGEIIQITAPISPGSSGSPVLNLDGEVVGVASLTMIDGQNVNFAVPFDRVDQLRRGTVSPVYAGGYQKREKEPQDHISHKRIRTQPKADFQTDATIRRCTEAIRKNPKDTRAYYNRAVAFNRKGDHIRAISDLNAILELSPGLIHGHIDRGISYRLRGDYGLAIDDFNWVLERYPQNAVSYLGRGLAYALMGELDRAIADFDWCLSLEPRAKDAVDALIGRGAARCDSEDYGQALNDLDRALILDPKNAIAYCERGRVFDFKRLYTQALADFDAALLIDSNLVMAYRGKGLVYLDMGNNLLAISEFNRGLLLDSNSVKIYSNRGLCYHNLGEYEKAIDDHTRALAIDPTYAAVYGNRGAAYAAAGDFDRVIEDYSFAFALDNRDTTVYYNRARAYYFKGDYTSAVADLAKALEINPRMLYARYLIGLAYGELGKKEEALSALRLFVEQASSRNTSAVEFIGEAKRRITELECQQSP